MKKTILISIVFAILYISLGVSFFQGGDYQFHYEKSNQGCPTTFFQTPLALSTCEGYTPLFHYLARLFSFSENAFFYFTILLFVLLTPIIIYHYTKNWYATLLYFFASNYIYYFMDGIYPQALAGILLFTLYYTKDRRIEFAIFPLLILAHGSGFVAGLFILFFKYFDITGWLCSSVFVNNQPSSIYDRIGSSGGLDFAPNNILHFFLVTFPIPYLWMALKESFDHEKKTFALIVFIIVAGFVYAPRVWYTGFLLAIPPITKFYERQSSNQKKYYVLFTLLIGVVQFYLFFNYHTQCST